MCGVEKSQVFTDKSLMKSFVLLMSVLSLPLLAAEPYNALVLETVREMPDGGGYSTGRDAFDGLKRRVQVFDDTLRIDHLLKGPSFCSSATYIPFLEVLEKIHRQTKSLIEAATAPRLLPTEPDGSLLPDGFGVWGRWNANGPGTAGLFHDLDLGENFSDDAFREAKAGDFLKIFWIWGRGVGKFERGHSVVFTKVLPEGATGSRVQRVCFWSSHGYEDSRPSGMGEKCVPRSDIQNMIFSRLQNPENINRVLDADFPHENRYLSSLLDTESTIEEARRETGARVVQP